MAVADVGASGGSCALSRVGAVVTDTGLTIDPTAGDSLVSASSIRTSIAQAIASSVPQGQHGAAGAIVDSDGTAHAFLAAKLGDSWQISTDLTKDGKHVSGKVMVAGSW